MTVLSKATHTGPLQIGDVELQCAVLEDGRRVVTQRGFLESMGRSIKAKGGASTGADHLPPFLAAKNLQPYLDKHITVPTTPILFRPQTGGRAYGYLADLLPDVCNVFLAARDDGALLPHQIHIAEHCGVLIRGLAKVGITALVDEATGYQKDRDRQELQRILSAFVAPELQPWVKRFPDQFYEQIFRLHGWDYPVLSGRRPGHVGMLTNTLVYAKFPPGVLPELRRRNPTVAAGQRKDKHHQLLTDEIGVRHLEMHLAVLISLMKAATGWHHFLRLFKRVFPGDYRQLELDLDTLEESAPGKLAPEDE